MATDKLINQTQGDDIIDALNDIADNVGNITYGPQTSADKVVSMLGYAEAAEAASINPGDTLNQAIGKLEKKADDNAAAVAGKIDKLTSATAGDIATVTATGEVADSEIAIETTLSDSSDAKVPTSKAVGTYVDGKGYAVGVNSSTANNLVAFNDANGKALKDSGIAVAKSSTGLTDSDTAVPTSKTVKTYVDSTATGISRYIGTITAASQLSTSAKKGDFYIVKTAWSGVHAGDEIIAETNNPAQTIDGTNWSLLHNEADTDTKYTFATGDTNGTFKVTPSDTGTAQSVAIKGLAAAAYKGVATSVSTSEDLVTSKAVNTKLASYVPNSDFVVAENNILYNLNMGAKNLLTIKPTFTINGLTSVQQSDGYTVKITGTPTGGKSIAWSEVIKISESGTYKVKLTLNGTMASCYLYDVTTSTLVHEYYSSNTYDETLTANHEYAMYTYSSSAVDATISAMLCTEAAYAQSTDYMPPALSNADLTVLEAEDRVAIADEIDAGAKNKLPIDLSHIQSINTGGTWNNNVYTIGNVTITVNSNKTITLNGTSSAVFEFQLISRLSNNFRLNTGTYTFSNSLTASTGGNWDIAVNRTVSGSGVRYGSDTGNGLEFTVTDASANTGVWVACNLSGTVFNNVTIKPMLCTKAAFSVSPKFVPYAKSNYSLTQLTSGLNATAYTPVQTVANHVKNIEGGYIRIGNLVIANIRCTVNAEIPTGGAFIDGLPYPIIQYGQSYGGASVSNNKGYGMTVMGTGSIGYGEGSGAIPVNTTLIMSVVYFAK